MVSEDRFPSLARIKEVFEFIQDWEARYEFIIDLGAKLPAMDDGDRIEQHRVHGCMSQVWICAYRHTDGIFTFSGDSDASTVKGLVAIMGSIYQGHTAEEILELDADAVFESLGLFDHLSPTRHVGVYAMVEHIKSEVRSIADLSLAGTEVMPTDTTGAPTKTGEIRH